MKRREFLSTVAVFGLGVTFGGFKSVSSSEGKPKLKNWAWIGQPDDLSPDNLNELFGHFRENGIAAILMGGDIKGYEKAAPFARKNGIELHAWTMGTRHTSEELQEKHPDWYMVNRNGISCVDDPPYVGYYKWLCPSDQDAREYITENAVEVAKVEGLTSVHLDYIRYPDVILPRALWEKYDIVQDKEYAQWDYCYCDDCRRRFREQYGKDPLKLEDPSKDDDWDQYRYDQITSLVNKIARAVKTYDKQVTAAVFPTPSIAKRLVRQEWPKWNLDAVMPMIYHSFYNKEVSWIEKATREGVNELPAEVPLYTGLYLPEMGPGELAEALDYAHKGGAKGVSLFNGNTPTEAHWKKWNEALKNYQVL
ncbi:MAG: family 10 glycosylhydrolase [Bacteroidales bacterium]|nr:family 10 glycosylhydrolase [Bacteroidales bacterium]MBS3776442.1 family 10 glycosylhydrolase [Bacteroidales bacterium]